VEPPSFCHTRGVPGRRRARRIEGRRPAVPLSHARVPWPVPYAPSLRAGPASRPVCMGVWRQDGYNAGTRGMMVLEPWVAPRPR